MGSAGEMPKMVKGAVERGVTRPHDEMLERPMSKRNRPDAARATPTPSKPARSRGCSMAGRVNDAANTIAK